MLPAVLTATRTGNESRLDRTLSLFTDVRAGEGVTALLMLVNIFLLLVCYSVIKTVREPLILLGGGAEVRSYAAAGQALLLMGLVPLYSWLATRVDRGRLLVFVTMFFIATIELFAAAVAAHVPYVGVAFFIWVGIFNMSAIAQFWSFANDIYRREAGDRLFPLIMIGMTAGAPIGSFIAARLFRLGITPQLILHVAAALLAASVFLYLQINQRHERETTPAPLLSAEGGFALVLASPYLRLIGALVVLLNIVNTTGEYMVARLLSDHVAALASADPLFNKQAYIGAYVGNYQFWVNIGSLLIQAFLTSRLVKHHGLRGALLALPLIALGGYAIIAAGAGISLVRWIKTAENATDYSIMNTARQLLWLPTSRDEKYKAKQAIDTFFVRGGDVLSALVVFVSAGVLHLSVEQLAVGNVVLTLVWIGVALLILEPCRTLPRFASRGAFRTAAGATVAAAVVALATPALAQAPEPTRVEQLAAAQAEKATRLHPYVPDGLERKLEMISSTLISRRPLYPFIGSSYPGGGLAIGPGYRGRFGDTGSFDVHAARSIKSYTTADATVKLPAFASGRATVQLRANWLDAPDVAFFGTGITAARDARTGYSLGTTSVGGALRFQATKLFAAGGGLEALQMEAGPVAGRTALAVSSPDYRRSHAFAEVDTRSAPRYTRSGGLYRVEFSDFRQTNAGNQSFNRVDAEVQRFIPLMRENWVIALRALASTTHTTAGEEVPYFLMPDLGGSKTLRGYPAWRFRDRNRMLLTGEYRWTAGPFVDMALFMDAGQVAARASDFAWRGFVKTYGVGASFHTLTSTVTRIELTRTPDGTALAFSFSPSF